MVAIDSHLFCSLMGLVPRKLSTTRHIHPSCFIHCWRRRMQYLYFSVGLSATEQCYCWNILRSAPTGLFWNSFHFFILFPEATAKLNWFWKLYLYFGVCRFFLCLGVLLKMEFAVLVLFSHCFCIIFSIKRVSMWLK